MQVEIALVHLIWLDYRTFVDILNAEAAFAFLAFFVDEIFPLEFLKDIFGKFTPVLWKKVPCSHILQVKVSLLQSQSRHRQHRIINHMHTKIEQFQYQLILKVFRSLKAVIPLSGRVLFDHLDEEIS